MITRAQYMADSANLHRPYFEEIAKETNAAALVAELLPAVRFALSEGDEYLNLIALKIWDDKVPLLIGAQKALKARGDFLSLGTGVCILKCAARAIVEAEKTESK